MLRKYQPRLFGLVGLMALLGALAVSAMAATSAYAEGGPVWIVLLGEVPLHVLAEGEKEEITGTGGVTVLESGSTEIECTETETTGEILGGNPGTNLSTITFLGCHLKGHATCVATSSGQSAGVIVSSVKTMLVYPHEKVEDAEAYDAFFPDNNETTNNLFVEFTLTGGATPCGLLNNFKVDVNATGTLVTDPSSINKKCGILALVGTLVTGSFANTVSGEENEIGAINAEGLSSPTLATWWMPAEKTFLLLECLLEAFGLESFQSGISDIKLVDNGLFGWELA